MKINAYRGLKHPHPNSFAKITMDYIRDVMAPDCQAGSTADRVYHRDAITLCDETVDYLYTRYTPLQLKYKPGSRPALEKIVKRLTNNQMTDRQKALRLLAWVSAIPDLKPKYAGPVTCGVTEEENIRQRNGNCGDLACILVCLCQIAGLPARIVAHYGTPGLDGKMLSGHAVTEIYLEKRWAYMDIRGIVYEWPDRRLASAIDLIRFPELARIQPPRVTRKIRPGYSTLKAESFFYARRVTKISNYFIWDAGQYKYTRPAAAPAGATAANARKLDAMRRRQKKTMQRYLCKFMEQGLYFPAGE